MSSNNKTENKVRNASAFDPRVPLLVQPFKRLVEEGFITMMTTVWTPTGVQTNVQIDSRVSDADPEFKVGTDYPAARIARLAEEKDLVPRKGKKSASKAKKETARPAKSLCEEDFANGGKDLLARAKSVASSIGGPGLVGRIMSLKDIKTPQGIVSFQDWWKSAPSEERYILLTDATRRAKLDKLESVGPSLATLKCPFLDKLKFGKEKPSESKTVPSYDTSSEEEEPKPAISEKRKKFAAATAN